MYRKESKGFTRQDGIVKEDSEFKSVPPKEEHGKLTGQGIIHSIHFHRLILDEAHSIKVINFSHSSYEATNSSSSNALQVLPEPVSRLKPPTGGAFLGELDLLERRPVLRKVKPN